MNRLSRTLSMLALVAAAAACATSTALAPTDRNPGSVGTVSAKESKNGNTQLVVEMKHLPPPEALDASLRTYVVWARPATGGQYTNLGQVAMRDDRSARLETLTPYEDVVVMVTAEASPTSPAPSPYVVLQGEVEAR